MIVPLLLATTIVAGDVDLVEKQIAAKHPNPYRRVSRETLHAAFDALRRDLSKLNDDEAGVRLMQAVALIRDGHTALFPTFDRWFPVRFYEFTDGLFITGVDKRFANLAGAQVTRIGTVDSAEALRLAKTAFASDNDFGAKEATILLSSAGIDRGLNLIDGDSLPLEVRLRDGSTQQINIPEIRTRPGFDWRLYGEMYGPPGVDLVTVWSGRDDLPLHVRSRGAYWFTYLQDSRVLYVQLNAMANKSSRTPETFTAFLDRLFTFSDLHPVEQCILDLRYNSGGNGGLINSIVHEIIKRDRSLGRPGHLFTLVGGKTFSAGLGLVIALREHTATVFAGEPPGAALNAFGDPDNVINSKFTLSVSTNYFVGSNFKNESWSLSIQLPARFSSGDYFGGRDPAVEAILAGNATMILDLLESKGGEAARALYEKRKAAFKDLSWWQPFGRGAMNALSYRLLEGGRTQDAIAGFSMNVDRFPDSWETWDSLAEALMAAKRFPEAIAAYRRALQLSPDNWNAAEERKAVEKMEGEKQ